MNWQLFSAFLVITLILFLTPGPIVTLVVTTGARSGSRAALLTVAGATTGNSLCAESIWDVQAVAVDTVTRARATITEGMSVRVSSDNIINSCP